MLALYPGSDALNAPGILTVGDIVLPPPPVTFSCAQPSVVSPRPQCPQSLTDVELRSSSGVVDAQLLYPHEILSCRETGRHLHRVRLGHRPLGLTACECRTQVLDLKPGRASVSA